MLVNAQGRTLYVFAPDTPNKSVCYGKCAALRPPVLVPTGTHVALQADVALDQHAPAQTPLLYNVMDSGAPTSRVQALPEMLRIQDGEKETAAERGA